MNRHLILVGLPGSGKTTVGQRAAALLSTAFSDIDLLVARSAGQSIATIFATEGEPAFRRLERDAVHGALAAPPHVIAPGGGWASQPGNLETAAGALLVYLMVSPEVAARRIAAQTGRPLFEGRDVLEAMRELLRQREHHYRRAQVVLDGDRDPELVARDLAALW